MNHCPGGSTKIGPKVRQRITMNQKKTPRAPKSNRRLGLQSLERRQLLAADAIEIDFRLPAEINEQKLVEQNVDENGSEQASAENGDATIIDIDAVDSNNESIKQPEDNIDLINTLTPGGCIDLIIDFPQVLDTETDTETDADFHESNLSQPDTQSSHIDAIVTDIQWLTVDQLDGCIDIPRIPPPENCIDLPQELPSQTDVESTDGTSSQDAIESAATDSSDQPDNTSPAQYDIPDNERGDRRRRNRHRQRHRQPRQSSPTDQPAEVQPAEVQSTEVQSAFARASRAWRKLHRGR